MGKQFLVFIIIKNRKQKNQRGLIPLFLLHLDQMCHSSLQPILYQEVLQRAGGLTFFPKLTFIFFSLQKEKSHCRQVHEFGSIVYQSTTLRKRVSYLSTSPNMDFSRQSILPLFFYIPPTFLPPPIVMIFIVEVMQSPTLNWEGLAPKVLETW